MKWQKKTKLERAIRIKKKIDARVLALRTDHETKLEFKWRDTQLEPLSHWWRTRGLTANQMTYLGFLFVAMAAYCAVQEYIWGMLLYGLLGFISDALDGAIARWVDPATGKNNVTGWGTFLDHTRDTTLIAMFAIQTITGSLAVNFVLLFMSIELALMLGVTTIYALIGIIAWSLFKKTYQANMAEKSMGFTATFCAFCLTHMQTSVWGRIQFGFTATAVVTLFVGIYFGIDFFRVWSYPLFGIAIGYGFRNIVTERWEVDE